MVNSVPTLPEEIIREILLYLPAKSIGQFRCVSKPWRDLLCNPEFVRNHLSRHTEGQEKVLLLSTLHSLYTLTFNDATATATTSRGRDGLLGKLNLLGCEDPWENVVGSCDGLALIVNEEGIKYLINPTTSEHVKVSNSPVALDPEISFSMHGFGYDSANDDYKIVTLSYYDTDNEHEPDCADTFLDVYSSKEGSWTRLGSSPYDHAVSIDDSGKFLNGALHWLASSKSTGYSSVITAFNLADEVFKELPPPASLDKNKFVFNRLVVLEGCLCIVDDHFHDHIDVWVMKEYGDGESWTKFTIKGLGCDDAKPLCPIGDKEYVVLDDNYLMVHNLEEQTTGLAVIDGPSAEFEDGVTFRESLVSPKFSC